jgi:hypothetical protein
MAKTLLKIAKIGLANFILISKHAQDNLKEASKNYFLLQPKNNNLIAPLVGAAT